MRSSTATRKVLAPRLSHTSGLKALRLGLPGPHDITLTTDFRAYEQSLRLGDREPDTYIERLLDNEASARQTRSISPLSSPCFHISPTEMLALLTCSVSLNTHCQQGRTDPEYLSFLPDVGSHASEPAGVALLRALGHVG